MELKAAFIDLDGTLLTKENKISADNFKAVNFLREKGVQVFLATGRPLDLALPHHRSLNLKTPLVCLNGAYVYDPLRMTPMLNLPMAFEEESLLYSYVDSLFDNFVAHSENGIYCRRMDAVVSSWIYESGNMPLHIGPFVNEKPEKILKYYISAKQVPVSLLRLFEKKCNVIVWDNGFELMRKGVHKWLAIKYLLNKYNIPAADTIAFGDGPNDFEMISNCGTGIAMNNAVPIVKSAADSVVHNDACGGIANYIKNLYPVSAAH